LFDRVDEILSRLTPSVIGGIAGKAQDPTISNLQGLFWISVATGLDLREMGANVFGKTSASVDEKVKINQKALPYLPEVFATWEKVTWRSQIWHRWRRIT